MATHRIDPDAPIPFALTCRGVRELDAPIPYRLTPGVGAPTCYVAELVADYQDAGRVLVTTSKRSGVEVWREPASGLLQAGWYAADDEGRRFGPFETRDEADRAVNLVRCAGAR
jgi:hypothetical protein